MNNRLLERAVLETVSNTMSLTYQFANKNCEMRKHSQTSNCEIKMASNSDKFLKITSPEKIIT